jgi:hypothetical protein
MDRIHLAYDKNKWRALCEQDNEILGSVKFWKILECLDDWWLLKKDSDACS